MIEASPRWKQLTAMILGGCVCDPHHERLREYPEVG